MQDRQNTHDLYTSPLAGRYASKEMQKIFSDENKVRKWRDLWINLAEAQMELGLDITEDQIKEMRNASKEIDFELAVETPGGEVIGRQTFESRVGGVVEWLYGPMAPYTRGMPATYGAIAPDLRRFVAETLEAHAGRR